MGQPTTQHPPPQEEKEPGAELTRPASGVTPGGGASAGGGGGASAGGGDKMPTQLRPVGTANPRLRETDALITTPEPAHEKKLEFREVKGTLTFKQKACFLIADGTLSNRKMLQVLLSRRGIGECPAAPPPSPLLPSISYSVIHFIMHYHTCPTLIPTIHRFNFPFIPPLPVFSLFSLSSSSFSFFPPVDCFLAGDGQKAINMYKLSSSTAAGNVVIVSYIKIQNSQTLPVLNIRTYVYKIPYKILTASTRTYIKMYGIITGNTRFGREAKNT